MSVVNGALVVVVVVIIGLIVLTLNSLFSYIDVVKSSFVEKSNKLEITLEKSINVSWKQLTTQKDNKIKIDWSNWTFIDDPPDNLFEIPNLSNTTNTCSTETLINSIELSDSDHSD